MPMPLKAALIHGLDPLGTNMKLVLISQYGSDLLSGTIRRSTYEGDPTWNYTVQV